MEVRVDFGGRPPNLPRVRTPRIWQVLFMWGETPHTPHVFARPPTLFAVLPRTVVPKDAPLSWGVSTSPFFGITWRPLRERRAYLACRFRLFAWGLCVKDAPIAPVGRLLLRNGVSKDAPSSLLANFGVDTMRVLRGSRSLPQLGRLQNPRRGWWSRGGSNP